MAYIPETPVAGEDPVVWLQRELLRISAELHRYESGMVFPLRTVAVAKPRRGMLMIPETTNWNPGDGFGLYVYTGTAWQKCGDPT